MSRPGRPRLVLAALAGGAAGGAVAGLGARLAMFVIRVMNPTHNGEVTHAGFENGRWTSSGTLAIVTGGIYVGLLGGAVYLLLRPLLPRRRSWLRGLLYGLLVFAVFGDVVLDGGYEYFRFVSTWVAVAMFVALYPVYGLVVAVVADAIATPPPASGRRRGVTRAAQGGLLVLAVATSVRTVLALRSDYFG